MENNPLLESLKDKLAAILSEYKVVVAAKNKSFGIAASAPVLPIEKKWQKIKKRIGSKIEPSDKEYQDMLQDFVDEYEGLDKKDKLRYKNELDAVKSEQQKFAVRQLPIHPPAPIPDRDDMFPEIPDESYRRFLGLYKGDYANRKASNRYLFSPQYIESAYNKLKEYYKNCKDDKAKEAMREKLKQVAKDLEDAKKAPPPFETDGVDDAKASASFFASHFCHKVWQFCEQNNEFLRKKISLDTCKANQTALLVQINEILVAADDYIRATGIALTDEVTYKEKKYTFATLLDEMRKEAAGLNIGKRCECTLCKNMQLEPGKAVILNVDFYPSEPVLVGDGEAQLKKAFSELRNYLDANPDKKLTVYVTTNNRSDAKAIGGKSYTVILDERMKTVERLLGANGIKKYTISPEFESTTNGGVPCVHYKIE